MVYLLLHEDYGPREQEYRLNIKYQKQDGEDIEPYIDVRPGVRGGRDTTLISSQFGVRMPTGR